MKAAEQILKQHKITITEQRIAILNLFLNSHEPLTHHDVEVMTDKSISRYTIYRTLLLFSKKGVLHILPSQGSLVAYLLFVHAHKEDDITHIHFVCRKCGKVDFISGISLPEIEKIGSNKIESVEVILKGHCVACK